MSRGRLEAFSDGVFAIIVTLLVLDLHAPGPGESVLHAVRSQLADLAVYAVAFLMVGVTWINHHAIFRAVGRVDRRLTVVNLLLLMFLALTPWAADLAADGLRRGGLDAKQGIFAFTLVFTLSSAMFVLLWYGVTGPGASLLADDIDPVAARAQRRGFGLGFVVYAVFLGLCFVLPWLVVAGHAVIAAYYLGDRLPIEAMRHPPIDATAG